MMPVPRRWARLAGVLVGTVLALVAGAAPASAHNSLTTTSPADGQSAALTPVQVVLTFDEPVLALGTQVVVSGPSGPVQQGPPRLVDNTVSQKLAPGAPAGVYTVTWRVTSTDGHPISGTFGFSSRAPSAGEPTPSEAPAADDPVPSPARTSGWLLLVVGAGVLSLVAAGIRLATVRRRRTS